MQTISVMEILYMNNATLLPKQAECIGKAYRHCILYKYILINGNAINIYTRIPWEKETVK